MPTSAEYTEAQQNWGTMTGEEKEQFVEDYINDMLSEYGSTSTVELGTEDYSGEGEDYLATYEDGTVTFDEDYLYNGEFDDIMETAGHEGAHAMQDPDEPDIYEEEYEDDADIFGEEEASEYNGFDLNDAEFENAFNEWAADNMESESIWDDFIDSIEDFWESLWTS